MLKIRELSFFNFIKNLENPYNPRFLGFAQDISTLLEVMLLTVRFIGLSGNTTEKRSKNVKSHIDGEIYLWGGGGGMNLLDSRRKPENLYGGEEHAFPENVEK